MALIRAIYPNSGTNMHPNMHPGTLLPSSTKKVPIILKTLWDIHAVAERLNAKALSLFFKAILL